MGKLPNHCLDKANSRLYDRVYSSGTRPRPWMERWQRTQPGAASLVDDPARARSRIIQAVSAITNEALVDDQQPS